MSIALIGGAGEGLGAALGRRFSKAHEVVLSSRTRGEKADLRQNTPSPVDPAMKPGAKVDEDAGEEQAPRDA